VNGLGLGNSTRCHAIIQRLHALGAAVDVITSGNGFWYFNGRPEVLRIDEIESLYYARNEEALSISRTLGAAADLIAIQSRNAKHVYTILRDRRPAAVIADSVYTFRPARRLGIPFLALNNANVVWRSYHRFRDRPASIRAQFYAVETMDLMFHRFIPDLVISPTLDPALPAPFTNMRPVGPIVRQDYDAAPRSGKPRKIVVMLSGSVFGTPVSFRRDDYPVDIHVVGRNAPPDWQPTPRVTFHGKVLDTQPFLADCDLAVINGGFSAVSEMFWMRKPMVVVPVPAHAEQWVNGQTIKHMGVGLTAGVHNYEDVMLEALARIDEFRSAYSRIGFIPNGAEQAAALILNHVERRS
jgi:uncharacterized protein (TIGR00661 family)